MAHATGEALECVDMHTVGMPSRILVRGYPKLQGTLLEQRATADSSYDHIRRRILLEPRGHIDMFGAILRPETELTKTGEAHAGVIYIHGGGYAYMCGHGTLALSRLLIDTHDLSVFPQRNNVAYDPETRTSHLKIQTIMGVVDVTVPTLDDGARSDPSRPVSFVAVPAWVFATDVEIPIPSDLRWPQLGSRTTVRGVSFGQCGAVSARVLVSEMGFSADTLRDEGKTDLPALRAAASQFRSAVNISPEYQGRFQIPGATHPSSLYGVSLTNEAPGTPAASAQGAELCQYVFGGEEDYPQLDRSPSGSSSATRVAMAWAAGKMQVGDSWTYHSLLSDACNTPGITATLLKAPEIVHAGVTDQSHSPLGPCIVQVEGTAYYTGSSTFIVEQEDHVVPDGFILGKRK